jgi:hypothetical protein
MRLKADHFESTDSFSDQPSSFIGLVIQLYGLGSDVGAIRFVYHQVLHSCHILFCDRCGSSPIKMV